MRLDASEPQVLRRLGFPLSTPSLVTNIVRLRHRSLTSCVVADRHHRRKCSLTMENTGSERILIDIGACVESHKGIIPKLLGAHALTGCDTVEHCFGIGKATAIKILRSGHSLQSLGEVHVSMEDIMTRATEFMAACYGSTKRNSMSEVRVDIWSTKMVRRKITAAPELKSLPPTTEAFEINVRRARIQTAIWKSACEAELPKLDPTVYGWKRDDVAKSLEPVQLSTIPHERSSRSSRCLGDDSLRVFV